jgi:hypothetical protein
MHQPAQRPVTVGLYPVNPVHPVYDLILNVRSLGLFLTGFTGWTG